MPKIKTKKMNKYNEEVLFYWPISKNLSINIMEFSKFTDKIYLKYKLFIDFISPDFL